MTRQEIIARIEELLGKGVTHRVIAEFLTDEGATMVDLISIIAKYKGYGV